LNFPKRSGNVKKGRGKERKRKQKEKKKGRRRGTAGFRTKHFVDFRGNRKLGKKEKERKKKRGRKERPQSKILLVVF